MLFVLRGSSHSCAAKSGTPPGILRHARGPGRLVVHALGPADDLPPYEVNGLPEA